MKISKITNILRDIITKTGSSPRRPAVIDQNHGNAILSAGMMDINKIREANTPPPPSPLYNPDNVI
jgi:hypothetical protein